MKQVAKVIVIDNQGKYLLMKRSNHPSYPFDYDLAGGTADEGEQPIVSAARELDEEIGVKVSPKDLNILHTDTTFSESNTEYFLFTYIAPDQPKITISWEHDSYEWVDPETFIKCVKEAKDTYMHMVAHALNEKPPQSKN